MFGRTISRLRPLVLLCAVVLVPGVPAVTAAQPRSVLGTVVDRAGQPVEGAAVKLKNTITLQVRSWITQQDGHYRFHGLHPDMEYSIQASRDGLSSKSREITRFESRESVRINLRLDVETHDGKQ